MAKEKIDVTEKMFGAACSGDIGCLDEFVKSGGDLNITYHKFGKDHSLVMGAYRNRQWETVRYLLDHRVKITPDEQQEVNNLYRKHLFLTELQTVISWTDPKDKVK